MAGPPVWADIKSVAQLLTSKRKKSLSNFHLFLLSCILSLSLSFLSFNFIITPITPIPFIPPFQFKYFHGQKKNRVCTEKRLVHRESMRAPDALIAIR